MTKDAMSYDTVVVGGGPAGLSAALVLGRACRRVLLCDAGQGRNAPAAEAHGIFTRDGTPPQELRRIGREQLRPYAVDVRDVAVVDIQRAADGFAVVLGDGGEVRARTVLLATGLVDELPPIPGLESMWGTGVFNCPYCHGWEVRNQPLAVYGRDDVGLHLATLLRGWSDDVVLCTDGAAGLTDEERGRLRALRIELRETEITRLDGDGGELERIVFADGTELPRRAMLLHAPVHQRSDLAARLGCAFTDQGRIAVDVLGATTVPGVAAAGDAVNRMPQVMVAAAGGATAAAGLNRAMLQEDAEVVVGRA